MGVHTPVELLEECRKDDYRSSPAASSALLHLLVVTSFLVFSDYQRGKQSFLARINYVIQTKFIYSIHAYQSILYLYIITMLEINNCELLFSNSGQEKEN